MYKDHPSIARWLVEMPNKWHLSSWPYSTYRYGLDTRIPLSSIPHRDSWFLPWFHNLDHTWDFYWNLATAPQLRWKSPKSGYSIIWWCHWLFRYRILCERWLCGNVGRHIYCCFYNLEVRMICCGWKVINYLILPEKIFFGWWALRNLDFSFKNKSREEEYGYCSFIYCNNLLLYL